MKRKLIWKLIVPTVSIITVMTALLTLVLSA